MPRGRASLQQSGWLGDPPAWSWSGSEVTPPFESDFPKASASFCVHLPPSPQSLAGAFPRSFVLDSFIVFFVFRYSP